jgi:hypothetical protein
LESKSILDFNYLIKEHELIVSKLLGEKPIKHEFFYDFEGELKSLGAWGGDFFLASTTADEKWLKNYFSKKGLSPIFSFSNLIL